MNSTISEASSFKNRAIRSWRILNTILPIAICITLLASLLKIVNMSYTQLDDQEQTTLLIIHILILLVFAITLMTNIGGIIADSDVGELSLQAFYNSCQKLKYFNVIAAICTIVLVTIIFNGKPALIAAYKILSPILSSLTIIIFSILPIILVIAFILLISPSIRQLAMWLSWNGYNDRFIAVTRRGNIRKYNRISDIPKKLPKSATADEIAKAIAKNRTAVKTAYPQKWKWLTF